MIKHRLELLGWFKCAVEDGDDFGTGSHDFGTLSGTLDFCIAVMIEGDVSNGDSAEMVVSASSSNSTALIPMHK